MYFLQFSIKRALFNLRKKLLISNKPSVKIKIHREFKGVEGLVNLLAKLFKLLKVFCLASFFFQKTHTLFLRSFYFLLILLKSSRFCFTSFLHYFELGILSIFSPLPFLSLMEDFGNYEFYFIDHFECSRLSRCDHSILHLSFPHFCSLSSQFHKYLIFSLKISNLYKFILWVAHRL